MPAYIVVRVDVTDPEQFAEYLKVTPGIIEQFGGKFLVRGGERVTLEGEEETRRMVIIEFPSMETAQAFYHSDEYAAAIELRTGASVAQFVAVDGVGK